MIWQRLLNEDDVFVLVHIAVKDRHRPYGNETHMRMVKFTTQEFRKALSKLIDYALEYKNPSTFDVMTAHFTCGCKKVFVSNKGMINHDDLDALCDNHWKEEILS